MDTNSGIAVDVAGGHASEPHLVVYMVRHAEVEHHHTDIGITLHGHEQARAAAFGIAKELRDGDAIRIFHSPVTRVRETAQGLYDTLLPTNPTMPLPEPDVALSNVRFIVGAGREPEEPSLLYAEMLKPERMAQFPSTRAKFYRGFWSSDDPMGYWLTHDSDGGAESPAQVQRRLAARLHEIFSDPRAPAASRDIYILVTHSGAMRALLRDAFGTDPGEPDFCARIKVEPSRNPAYARLSYDGKSAQLRFP